MAGILELLDQQGEMAHGAMEEAARSQTRRDISNIEQKSENIAALGQIAGTIGSYYAINKQLKKGSPLARKDELGQTMTKAATETPGAVTPAGNLADAPGNVDHAAERPVHAGNAMLVGNVYRSLLGPL